MVDTTSPKNKTSRNPYFRRAIEMSLIEQLEAKETMEFFNVTLAPGDIGEPDGGQLFLATKNSDDILKSICSICKQEFRTDDEYEKHADSVHKNLQRDDKDVLKKTSELSAMFDAVEKHNPLFSDLNDETTEKSQDIKEYKDDSAR